MAFTRGVALRTMHEPRHAEVSDPLLDLIPVGSVALSSRLWRVQGGTVHATIAIKATFGLVDGGPMCPAEPTRLEQGSSSRADELVPYLSRADVLFYGSAYSPGEEPVDAMSARLALVRGEEALVDKTLHIYGKPDSATGRPRPFRSASCAEPTEDAPIRFATPSGEVGGLGPVASSAPARRRFYGYDPGPRITEIPSGFDWSMFQAAPRDQQVDALRGDEWLVLHGLTREPPSIRTRLPGVEAFAQVLFMGQSGMESRDLALLLDTLLVDGDAACASLIWRGSFPVATADVLRRCIVTAGISTAQDDRSRASEQVALSLASRAPAKTVFDGPFQIVDVAEAPTSSGPRAERRLIPVSADDTLPWERPGPPPRSEGLRKRMMVTTRAATGASAHVEATTAERRDEPATASGPFELARAGGTSLRPLMVPGAPWSGAPSGDGRSR